VGGLFAPNLDVCGARIEIQLVKPRAELINHIPTISNPRGKRIAAGGRLIMHKFD